MSDKEKSYIEQRNLKTSSAHKQFLDRVGIGDDFDVENFYELLSKPVIISIAISGGGFRSMLNGAGALSAFDSRTPNSSDAGHLGGILQSASYLAGVSGGSWLVSSLVMHDFKPVVELRDSDHFWKFEQPLLEGVSDIDFESRKNSFSNSRQTLGLEKRYARAPLSEFRSEHFEKRQIARSIRVALEDVLAELNNLSGDLSSYAVERLRRLRRTPREIPRLSQPQEYISSFITLPPQATYSVSTTSDFSSNGSHSVTRIDTHTSCSTGPSSTSYGFDYTSRYYANQSEDNSLTTTCDSEIELLSTSADDFFDDVGATGTETLHIPFHSSPHTLTTISNNSFYVKSTPEKSSARGQSWSKISKFYQRLHFQVKLKKLAGFRITFTDYWARALADKLFAGTVDEYSTPALSDVEQLDTFKSFDMPFPIILTNARWPNTPAISHNSQVYEFTPYEFGSWDHYLNAFVNTKYLGSALFNNTPIFKAQNGSSLCVAGFDDIGFITATSSSLFNNVLIYVWQAVSSARKRTSDAMKLILFTLGLGKSSKERLKNHPDYALVAPNPFYGYKDSGAPPDVINSPQLFLVDGGEDKQNIPFHPFLQKARNVDIIFAIDSTSDRNNLPKGVALRATFNRYKNNHNLFNMSTVSYKHGGDNDVYVTDKQSALHHHSTFPRIPTLQEMESNNFIQKPTFFGCNLSDYPSRREAIFTAGSELHSNLLWLPPLIVYLPNYAHTFPSNTSTFKLSYTPDEVFGMINNGYNIVTQQNSTGTPLYDKCIACATLKREFDRIQLGMNANYFNKTFEVPQICATCFANLCYS